MPDPLKGDYRMDPATSRRRHPSGEARSAFNTTLGVALAILLVLAVVFGLVALFLLPA
jgi:hypothetical protein